MLPGRESFSRCPPAKKARGRGQTRPELLLFLTVVRKNRGQTNPDSLLINKLRPHIRERQLRSLQLAQQRPDNWAELHLLAAAVPLSSLPAFSCSKEHGPPGSHFPVLEPAAACPSRNLNSSSVREGIFGRKMSCISYPFV